MDDSREVKIRKELLGSVPPTSRELHRKYRIDHNVLSKIRRDLGLNTSTRSQELRERIYSEIARDPTATDYSIAERLEVSHHTVKKYRLVQRRESGQVAIGESEGSSQGNQNDLPTFRSRVEAAFESNPNASNRELADILGIAYSTVCRYRRSHNDGREHSQTLRRRTSYPPKDPDQAVQWMWRQVKELRINLKYALRRTDDMATMLNGITEIIERLRPFEPWLRYYSEGVPGYGSLPLFLAERSEVELDALRTRLREAGDLYHQLMDLTQETEVEVHTNGTGGNIPD